jgi:hypothetical protein
VSNKPLPSEPRSATGDDTIVSEIRAVREGVFARAGYDLQELGRQLRARQVASGREGVTLPPKPPESDSHAA